MSLRRKTLLIIGITHLGLIALLFATSRSILLAGYMRLEREEVQRSVQQVEQSFASEVIAFRQDAEGLAFSDETTAYFAGRDPALASVTFGPAVMASHRLNLVLLLDPNGLQVVSRAFDWRTRSATAFPDGLTNALPPNGQLGRLLAPDEHISGFLRLPDGPMLITVLPVLTGQQQGPARGTLIVGRWFDQAEIERLAQSTQSTLDIYDYHAEDVPDPVASARAHLANNTEPSVRTLDSEQVAGYGLIRDVYGAAGLIVQVTLPRDIYRQGQSDMRYIVAALLSSGVVFTIMVLGLLELTILTRLTQLSDSVRRVAQLGDPARRIAVAGDDELSHLGQSVNTMLETLQVAQQQQQAGEQRLRAVVANVPIILFALDLKGRFTLLEGQALGDSNPADYLGQPVGTLFGDAPSVVEDVQRALEGEALIAVVEAGDKVFEMRYIPMRGPGSSIESVIGVATDITERERAESAGHEQRRIAEALRDTASALTGTLDLDEVLKRILTSVGQVVSHDAANIMLIEDGQASVARSLGYAERGLEEWITDLKFPLERIPRLERVVANRCSDVITDTHKATGWLGFPELHWVRSSISVPIRLEGQQVMGLLNLDSATTDFFTPKHADWLQSFADQAALALQNARFYEAERYERRLAQMLRKTAEAFASAIHIEQTLRLIIEQLGQVVRCKRAAILLVDDDRLRVAGTSGFPADDPISGTSYAYEDIALFREVLLTKNPVVIADAPRDPRWVALPGFDSAARSWIGVGLMAHDVPLGLLSISGDEIGAYSVRDVEAVAAFAQQAALAIENARILAELEASLASLREAQTHLVRTTRLSAAGEIAAGVAHQINNPLTTVIAEAYLLAQTLDPSDPNLESAEAIREAGMRAATVVRRLLDLTRTHPYHMEPLDINESLESSIALIRAQMSSHVSRIEVQLQPGLPLVTGSAQHLEDIWINLLLNARDAVRAEPDSLIRVTSSAVEDGEAVRVTVQDNGTGIAPEKLAHIFEPFFTTKDYGTGLGLSICHDVVTRHGGQIEVDSIEGQGTTFTITLPAAFDPAKETRDST